jgi:soluble lytic murein transglycosylase-like protein
MFTSLLALLCGLLVSLSSAAGQSSGPPGQPFAAIDASLAEAADIAIAATGAMQPKANPLAHAQETQTLAASVFPQGASQRNNQRVDALGPRVQPILSKEGVPGQLAAVMQIESGGDPLALSPKGARGLWQLMPDTARRYGLRVDGRMDERLDLEKATTSAARYLRDLYSQFGSWPLALAAYNTGELNLQRAIDRARSRDFPTLSALGYLPAETRNYVPAVLAAMGSQPPSTVSPARNARPARLVYATSEEPGH